MRINNEQLIASFTVFATAQNIDKPTLIRMLDDVLRSLITKKYGTDTNFDIIINPNKGDLQIWRSRQIVADDDPACEAPENIPLAKARKIEADFEVGEEVAEEIGLDTFSRRGIMQALQLLIQKRQTIAEGKLYERYKEMVGNMLTLEVYHAWGKEAILHDEDKNELYLPRIHQLPRDRFKKGDYIQAIVHEITLHNNKLRIILSRTSPKLLEHLMESEIPEIADGRIIIKQVGRLPGKRAKVVVATYDDRIDPVGACIGPKGARIKGISKEIGYEQIDILQHTDNFELYLSRLLSPAKLRTVTQNEGRIEIYLSPDQVPLAIGVHGQNINLASQMIGMPIDIFRELETASEEDVHLDEFADEVAEETLEKLKSLGLTTARKVLEKPVEALAEETGLPLETLSKAYAILAQELTPPPPLAETPAEGTSEPTDNPTEKEEA